MGKSKVKKEKIDWKCFPPFVDAYQTSPYDWDKGEDKLTSIKDFKSSLKDLAYDWDKHTIGEQYLRQDGYVYEEDNLVCIVVGYYGRKSYGLFVPKNWGYKSEEIVIKEFNYPEEWDVT